MLFLLLLYFLSGRLVRQSRNAGTPTSTRETGQALSRLIGGRQKTYRLVTSWLLTYLAKRTPRRMDSLQLVKSLHQGRSRITLENSKTMLAISNHMSIPRALTSTRPPAGLSPPLKWITSSPRCMGAERPMLKAAQV
jgi:hypothetical protein